MLYYLFVNIHNLALKIDSILFYIAIYTICEVLYTHRYNYLFNKDEDSELESEFKELNNVNQDKDI